MSSTFHLGCSPSFLDASSHLFGALCPSVPNLLGHEIRLFYMRIIRVWTKERGGLCRWENHVDGNGPGMSFQIVGPLTTLGQAPLPTDLHPSPTVHIPTNLQPAPLSISPPISPYPGPTPTVTFLFPVTCLGWRETYMYKHGNFSIFWFSNNTGTGYSLYD